MFHNLTKKEIKAFIRRYLNECDDYTKDIHHISKISYNNVTEYLINHKYILKVYH